MDKIPFYTSAAPALPSIHFEHNVPHEPRPKSSKVSLSPMIWRQAELDRQVAVDRFHKSNDNPVRGEPQQVENGKRSKAINIRQEAQQRQQPYEERHAAEEQQRRDDIERRQMLEREELRAKAERQKSCHVERQQIAERQQISRNKPQQRQLDQERQLNETERKRLEFSHAEIRRNEDHKQKRSQNAAKETLNRVQAFFTEIYSLETWILEHRYALHNKRSREFGDSKCKLANKILKEILQDINLWHENLFEPKQWILVQKIKKGLSNLALLDNWHEITPWGEFYDQSSLDSIVVLAKELMDTMEVLSPLMQESLTPESCPTVAREPDIPTPQNGSRSLEECDIPNDRSTLQKSSSESCTLESGREPEVRTTKARARIEPAKRPCSWLPQVSTCAPQANSRPSKVSKRSQSSSDNNRVLQRLQSTTRPQAFNSRDVHSSESGSEQETNRPPPPAPDPSSTQSTEKSKRFPCLNTIGEPEVFRNCKHSFEHISQLARHMKTHNFFVCHKCIRAFEGEQELVAHEQLPHSRCKSRGCRRYRACACEADLRNFSNFHCGACICSSKSKFDALLVLKYPHIGQQPSNTTANFNPGDQSGSSKDVPMNGAQLEYNELFGDLCVNSMDTDMQIEWQDFDFTAVFEDPSGTTASNEVDSTTSTSNDTTSDASGHRDATEERLQQLTKEVSDLKGKVEKLEEGLNHPATPRPALANPALEHVLEMVWQELVLSGNPKVRANAPLYNLVQCIAPNVIASSQVFAQSPRHDSVLSYVAPAAASFTNFTSGSEKGKQKGPSIGLFPGVGLASS